ncbi:unnamed protein product, partial [Rotaria sordida]
MGNRTGRMKGSELAQYGGGYNPYYGYGEMENYNLNCPPIEEDYLLGMGNINQPFGMPFNSPMGGLGSYGNSCAAYFNSMIQPSFGRVKMRQIFMPNNVLSAFQNLLQQGGIAGYGTPQMMPQMPIASPPMMPQMPFVPPPMMPQMPFAPSMMPQMP